jgi:hypothetical protein
MLVFNIYTDPRGQEVNLCKPCAEIRRSNGEVLKFAGTQAPDEIEGMQFGECDDCGREAQFHLSSRFASDIYGLDTAMQDEELASPNEVASRLMRTILGLGSLSHMDAIRIVWNEFGGKYTYETEWGTKGLRSDVLREMKLLGAGRYSFREHPKRWEKL